MNRPISSVPFYRSIGFILTTVFLLLAIVPSATFAALVIDRANREAREQASNQLESVASTKTQEVERWLESGQTVLQLVLLSQNQELEQLLQSDLETEAVLRKNEALQQELAQQGIFNEFFIYTPTGEIMFSSALSQVGKTVSLQPYFEHSLLSFHIEVPYYDVATSRLTIIFTIPIMDAGVGLVGVLAGRADVDELSEIMTNRVGLGDTGETYLVSRENNYFVTPSRFEGYGQNQAYHSYGIDQALAEQNGSSIYADYRGGQVIGVYRWLPELELGLIAEIDEGEALEAGRDLRIQSLLTAIGLAMTALLFGITAARWLISPLRRLTRAAEAVAAGQYENRVAVRRNNEIGVLGEAFNRMADQLVSKIAELDQRLKELDDTNRALKIATNKAREVARLKGEFLSTMSHELRTPLNAMEGFTSIMLSKMGGAEYNEASERYLQRIDANNKRLLQLINDFLDLSRIESGRLELVQTPFEVAPMVKHWQEQIGVLADQKGLAFAVHIEEGFPSTLYGDQEAISKIAFNLLSNAVKFTEQGNVELSIKAAEDTWLLQVSDTGIGIPLHAREYIFEEFRQVDQSSKRLYGGTGLGLAIVQKLARLMNGTITLKSEVGQGSTFTLTLPLVTTTT